MMLDIDRARTALSVIPPNLPRSEWHEIGRAAIAAGLTVDDIDNWSATAENYKGRRDIESAFRTVKSNGGTGAGTLFYYAKQYGFDGTENKCTPITHAKITAHKPFKQKDKFNTLQVWEQCLPATANEPYIKKKQGNPDGLRVYPASMPPLVIRGRNVTGYLVVPCWSGDNLQTLQFIPPDGGDKLNLPGASFGDGFFIVGEVTDLVYICEGIGQSWAVNRATNAAAVVCFGSGRMMKVAKVLRTKYPDANLVIAPDRGKEEQAANIAAAVAGHWIELPDDKSLNYDCNDFAQEFGISALSDLLKSTQSPKMRYRLLTDDDMSKLPPIQWRIKKILPKVGLAAVFGASGSGKSFLVIDMMQALAVGNDWFGYKSKTCNVLYCALEGESGVAGRVNAYRIRYGTAATNILGLRKLSTYKSVLTC